MKRNFTIVFAALIVFCLFQTSSLKLQSHIAQPAQGGLAGDPGQTTCSHCHNDISNTITRNSQFTIKISQDSAGLSGNTNAIADSGLYTPDYTQWISVELHGANGATPVYGFQFTALKANDSMAGSFTLVNAKTSIETSASSYQPVLNGPVTYVGHKRADTTRVWYFKWTAPHSGKVNFYYTGNLGNGDATYNGDSIFEGSVSLNAGLPSGINNVRANINSASVYPVPFTQTLNAKFDLNTSAEVKIVLMSLDGKLTKELYSGFASQGAFNRSFDLNDVEAGVYLVRINSGAESKTIKVIKY